jgi:hypothetical protein
MDAVGLKRQEVGLRQACRFTVGLFGFKDPLQEKKTS